MKTRIILYVILFLCIALIYALTEETLHTNEYELCIFHGFTGIACPLCGMTRAGNEILHLNFKQALIFNPLIYFIPYFLIVDFLTFRLGKAWLKKLFKYSWVVFFLAATVLFAYRIYLSFGQ